MSEKEQDREDQELLNQFQEDEEELQQEEEGEEEGVATNDASDSKEKNDEIIQQKEEDKRSIFVQNVEYNTTKEELMDIFKDCGEIEKITIPQTRQGQGKGFAYIQFVDKSSVELAKALSDSIHRGRAIKVLPKRTNQHGFKKKSFKPNGFSKSFPYMKNSIMKGFMFGGAGYYKKKFNPH
ncbi:polyadenylate-binding protein (macronuclear) [Tetrahymena thermophila SB210]|uniref:Polyadenylate-binding protein n=1 Tax=Tetrahymena thermophila (strain SB210) TaxID=312017 RepID=Q23QD3_TETTS|nr:polyadenylate-binding protein [Tetrahymena thermophila SB210]EAR98651.1 polyadenylate-binding protein [Tetrahymena thermophila SB210]|eukprot:XP_001018896.1 polyadenylate-binding protein [Tetrahymena thermophila SB210]